jgi:hypothetical protein
MVKTWYSVRRYCLASIAQTHNSSIAHTKVMVKTWYSVWRYRLKSITQTHNSSIANRTVMVKTWYMYSVRRWGLAIITQTHNSSIAYVPTTVMVKSWYIVTTFTTSMDAFPIRTHFTGEWISEGVRGPKQTASMNSPLKMQGEGESPEIHLLTSLTRSAGLIQTLDVSNQFFRVHDHFVWGWGCWHVPITATLDRTI